MEIKEAIAQLKWYFENDDGGAAENKTKEAAYMAIAALVEKQDKEKLKMENMTNDSINRQAAIEEIRTYITEPNISDDESEIKGYNDGLELAISVLSVLPSAQLKQKRGKWIGTNNPNYSLFDSRTEPYNAICSECFYTSTKKFNYCPNCGAEMDGKTE